MAIDRWKSRQVACKIVNLEGSIPKLFLFPLRKPVNSFRFAEIRKNPLRHNMIEKLWREVELLKSISHVSVLNHLRLNANYDQPNIVRVEQVFRSTKTM